MAGGYDPRRVGLDVVEMINLETMSSCIVDVNLDQPRWGHIGVGNQVCGGHLNRGYAASCYNIATRTTVNLIDGRYGHSFWSTVDGLYLIGGYNNKTTTELINGDTTQAGFGLQYSTE